MTQEADYGARIMRVAVIDGEQVPLTECDWLHVAPCGCACGIAVAEHDAHLIADAEAAMLEFTSTLTRREVERDKGAGFTVRLIRHEEFVRNRDLLTIKCPHDPPWGVPPIPKPDGWEWAVDGWRSRTRHLVRSEAVYRGNWRTYAEVSKDARRALCGAGGSGATTWGIDEYQLDRTLECSRCVKKATDTAAPSAPIEAAS